jgi:uncharacterized membrane protein YbhN (UPF0104 family)
MEPAKSAWQRIKLLAPVLWLGIVTAAAYVIAQRLGEIDPSQVWTQLREQVSLSTLVLGLSLTTAYFLLVAAYEVLMVRASGADLPWWRACLTGWIASPIGHAVGLSTFSAGALRYRLYTPQGLSARQIGGIVVVSALPWLLGLGWLLDATLVVEGAVAASALHLPVVLVITLGLIGLAKDAGYLVFVARRRTPVTVGSVSVPLPSLPATLLQAAIGVLQISLMAALLYSLMPSELEMSLAGFIPVYVIAILVANSSNVPAGLGVLEASLLLMLPQVPASKLLGAVLAYRAIFDLLPLAMSVLLLTIYEAGSRHGLAGRWWRITGRDAVKSEVPIS